MDIHRDRLNIYLIRNIRNCNGIYLQKYDVRNGIRCPSLKKINKLIPVQLNVNILL